MFLIGQWKKILCCSPVLLWLQKAKIQNGDFINCVQNYHEWMLTQNSACITELNYTHFYMYYRVELLVQKFLYVLLSWIFRLRIWILVKYLLLCVHSRSIFLSAMAVFELLFLNNFFRGEVDIFCVEYNIDFSSWQHGKQKPF